MWPFSLDQVRRVMSSGVKAQAAPGLLQGFLNQFLDEKRIGLPEVVDFVKRKADLWDMLPALQRQRLQNLTQDIGPMPWFTPDWLINAVAKGHPTLASLFLKWRPARTWLTHQVRRFRQELDKPDLV